MPHALNVSDAATRPAARLSIAANAEGVRESFSFHVVSPTYVEVVRARFYGQHATGATIPMETAKARDLYRSLVSHGYEAT